MRVYIKPTIKGFSYCTYCVYAHSINGQIFYIGSGTPYRAYQLGGLVHRNEIWLEMVSKNGHFDVDIMGWFTDKRGMKCRERELIAEHQPIANKRMTGRLKEGVESRGVTTPDLVRPGCTTPSLRCPG